MIAALTTNTALIISSVIVGCFFLWGSVLISDAIRETAEKDD